MMLSADTIAWSSIALATIHTSFTDISVIHGKYALDFKKKVEHRVAPMRHYIDSVWRALPESIEHSYTHGVISRGCRMLVLL